MTTAIRIAVGYLQAGKAVAITQIHLSGESTVATLRSANTYIDTNVWDGTDVVVREVDAPADDAAA